VRQNLYDLGHHVYEAHELYCPIPECNCGKVVIDFEARSPRGAAHPGSVVVSSADPAATLEPSKRGQARLEQLWAAFQQRHPHHAARFAGRDARIKSIGARFVGPEEADASPKAKVGPKRPMPLRIRPEVQKVLRSFPSVAGTSVGFVLGPLALPVRIRRSASTSKAVRLRTLLCKLSLQSIAEYGHQCIAGLAREQNPRIQAGSILSRGGHSHRRRLRQYRGRYDCHRRRRWHAASTWSRGPRTRR
jgi:hypothetical protein